MKRETPQVEDERPAIAEKLETYLSERLGGQARIEAMKSLSGGACQDNYLVELDVADGPESGHYSLVMRTDKGGSLLSSLPKPDEFAVCAAAFAAGVTTPRPYWLEENTEVIGNPFYFMERIDGNAAGRYVVKDRSLAEYRKRMSAEIAGQLAKIHSVRPDGDHELGSRLDPAPSGPTGCALRLIERIRSGVAELPEAHPALELGLNWLTANAPTTSEHVLVHGDFRTGNFMISPEGLHGIIDWEFAHWGDRHEDISWLCMRDWRFGKHNRPVGGFGLRDEFYAAYEKASGVPVLPESVRYFEIAGNAAWALGAAQQAERHLSGADRGIEYASIGRRACEMEYEMLRLIEDAG